MKRQLRIVAIALILLLCVAGFRVWDMAFHAPAVNLLPLPANLIALDSAEGQKLLSEQRFTADYSGLHKNFESQSRPAFCGVASSVIVLNALSNPAPRLSQSAFFNDAAGGLSSALQVTFGGMTLAQLGNFLSKYDVHAVVYPASQSSLANFRALARHNLQTPGDFLLVNYEREVIGQKKTGHISPIAAYNETADRMLIMDVASYKYPPVWVSTGQLWQAMNTVDGSSGQSRGFVVVRGQLKR